jgi:hypothetical protein
MISFSHSIWVEVTSAVPRPLRGPLGLLQFGSGRACWADALLRPDKEKLNLNPYEIIGHIFDSDFPRKR